MKLPFDRVVLVAPHRLHLENLGSQTEIELESFGSELPNIVWEQISLPVRARKASILFCPTYTGPLIYPGRMVVHNHGIYEALPSEFSRIARFRATTIQKHTARRACRVIANSIATKADLVKFFHLSESKLETIYPAAHDIYFERHRPEDIRAEVLRVLGKDVPYIIFVGKLAKRRHVPNLIRAFSLVREQHRLPHHLLIVGPNTTQLDIAALAGNSDVAAEVVYHPHAEMRSLAYLYAGAQVYALPTIYEGISWTMFEAMASGTPVLTVEHPTLVEGGADSVLSVPTPSVSDLVSGLSRLLTDPALRHHYSEAGRQRAKLFSWQTVAQQTACILDRAACSQDIV
ncbi:MAG: glycosyltransferase family 4 protein [Acidobacteriota bacterium]|nr:glycosyltransferase family 4 protein [Acidobacteriota bacterium]